MGKLGNNRNRQYEKLNEEETLKLRAGMNDKQKK